MPVVEAGPAPGAAAAASDRLDHQVGTRHQHLLDHALVERRLAAGVDRDLHVGHVDGAAQGLEIPPRLLDQHLGGATDAGLVVGMAERVATLGIAQVEFDPRTEMPCKRAGLGEDLQRFFVALDDDQDGTSREHSDSPRGAPC